ncbi:ABC transporter ATP-binding protein [Nitrospinota bacterium]
MSVTVMNLSKSFATAEGIVRAVQGLNLQIKRGEFFSLLGPSGCGKTTTIRCLAGLETPDEGEIYLGDELVFSRFKGLALPTYERKIGMVFQSYAIWPHMNVFDNVAFPLKCGMREKLAQREIRERVTAALGLVHMEGFESRPSTQLSGGQQQRVALARSLVRNPEVVLLDEPLSNLDAKLRTETRLELRQLWKKLGITAVYVTHDQVEAFAVSDRIGVMLDGRLVQVGAPRDIYLQPSETFIADFVGRINFLEGEVIQEKARAEKKSILTPIGLVECPGLENMVEGRKLKLGIRAESIRLCSVSEVAAANCFSGIVRGAVFLGEYVDCEVSIDEQSFYVKLPPEQEVKVGTRVGVLLPRESWVILP